jgi:hypothetical protein
VKPLGSFHGAVGSQSAALADSLSGLKLKLLLFLSSSACAAPEMVYVAVIAEASKYFLFIEFFLKQG